MSAVRKFLYTVPEIIVEGQSVEQPTGQVEIATPKGASSFWAGWPLKLGLLAILVALGGVAYGTFGNRLSLVELAEHETSLRNFLSASPWSVTMIAIGIYILVAGLSLPGAAALSMVYGWYFGFWWGFLVVSIGSTAGATAAFLATRYLLRDWIQQKFADRLKLFNDAVDREGAFYLFTLRLVPAVPFFVINAVMGLTRIRVTTFWWVSQLGMVPGTAAFVSAGANVPSLKQLAQQGAGSVLNWQLITAFAILGLLPLIIKKSLALLGIHRNSAKISESAEDRQGTLTTLDTKGPE